MPPEAPHATDSVAASQPAHPIAAQRTTFPRPARRDPALDGLRGLAILLVFLFHYGGGLKASSPALRALGYLTQTGWVGVVLFFVLSGFLITGIVWDSLEHKHLIRNFFARRALRILPLYGLALTVAFLGAITSGGLAVAHAATIKSFVVYLFFLQDIPGLTSLAQQYHSPYAVYHLWSLAVEEQFYLLWPFLLLATESRRGARMLCLRLFGLSALFRIIVCLPQFSAHRDARFGDFLLTHAGALALGGAVALALRSRNRETGRIAAPVRFLRKHAVQGIWGGLAIFAIAGALGRSFLLSTMPMFALGLPAITVTFAGLICVVLRRGATRSIFSLRPLVALGRISYGFYVFHILLQPWFDAIARGLTHADSSMQYQLVRMLAAFPITVVVAALSWRLLEQPILRLGRRFPLAPSTLSELGLHSSAADIPVAHHFAPRVS